MAKKRQEIVRVGATERGASLRPTFGNSSDLKWINVNQCDFFYFFSEYEPEFVLVVGFFDYEDEDDEED